VAGCVRPWLRRHTGLDRVVLEGMSQIWRRLEVCNKISAPSTHGYLLALLHTLHPCHEIHVVEWYGRICFGTGINEQFSRPLKHKNAYHEKRHSLRVSLKGLNCVGDHTWSFIWIPINNISSQRTVKYTYGKKNLHGYLFGGFRSALKGGPEPLESELNELLGFKHDNWFSDHSMIKFLFSSFFVPAYFV